MRDPKDKHESLVRLLDDGIQRLIHAGANVIGIACNTIHYLIPRLPKYDIKLMNIVDLTVHRVEK
jgi:aspartate/glutamate racemase